MQLSTNPRLNEELFKFIVDVCGLCLKCILALIQQFIKLIIDILSVDILFIYCRNVLICKGVRKEVSIHGSSELEQFSSWGLERFEFNSKIYFVMIPQKKFRNTNSGLESINKHYNSINKHLLHYISVVINAIK